MTVIEQATAYAKHDERVVTRGIILGLIAEIKARDGKLADLERRLADKERCEECLGKVARGSFDHE
jgi:hypothetical protein